MTMNHNDFEADHESAGTKRAVGSPSRRRFLVGSALAGLGAFGLPSSVAATDEDGDAEGSAADEEDRSDRPNETEEGARIVHLSPDAPVVDVYVDDELWFEDVEPFATQTEYLEYVPGTYTVQFTPAGRGPDEAVLEDDVTFEEGHYTVAAVGEACAASDERLRITTFEDDTSPTRRGHARVRGVNASPDAPEIDFTVDDGERTLVGGLPFGKAGFAEVPADQGVIETRADDDGAFAERFAIDLEAGHAYTAFAVGYVDEANTPEAAVDNASFALAITEDAAPGEE